MDLMIKAFNEWMRRYIEEPERFSREFQEVVQYNTDVEDGVEPSYGLECAAYLQSLMNELRGS